MLFNAGPPVRRWPSVKTRCTTTRLHVTVAYRAYTHAHNTLSTTLTRLHSEGWCLVDFFKPADWIYRVHEKGGGARLLGVVCLLGIIRVCYGSTAIINIFTLTARGSTLDVRI